VKSREVLSYALVGSRAWDVALSRDEATAYVANGLSDDITVIDMATMTPLQSLPVGRTPHSIRVDD
jgi:YVTN family beta-propeller protein